MVNANVVVAAHRSPRLGTTRQRVAASVMAALLVACCIAAAAPLASAATPAAPVSPTNGALTLTTNGARANFTWTNPTTGGPVSYDTVTLIDITNPSGWYVYGIGARCYNCASYTFNSLLAGHTYWAVVQPTGPGGSAGPGFAANVVTANQSTCTNGGFEACISVDTTSKAGAETHPGSGLLNAADAPAAMTDKVAPTWWRYGTGSATNPEYSAVTRAKAYNAKTIEDLSRDWGVASLSPTTGLTAAPWANNWADWDAFVKAKVARSAADNMKPSYWQVWNEPGGNIPNLGTTNEAAFTPAVQLELYKHTWTDIRSVDPSAKISSLATVGLHDHADEVDANPPASMPGQVALDQFVSYLNANNLTVDLVTWHDTPSVNWINVDGMTASRMRREVAAAKAVLTAGGLGSVPIAFDEFTSVWDHTIPAWTLDSLVGIEESGVVGAMRSCWWDKDPTGLTTQVMDGCLNGSMDNLLTPLVGTLLPQARSTLWVYDAYRQMTGTRLNVTSSSDWVSALASSSSASSISVMLGRHWTCLPGPLNPNCGQSWFAIPAPTNQQVNVTLPNGTWAVTAKSITPTWGSLVGPVTKTGVITSAVVTNGKLSISVPAVADGEVVTLVLTRTA